MSLPVGFASHTPWPLKTPALVVGSQHGVPPLQSADFWQTTPHDSLPALSFTHSASELQQLEPQDAALAGQHALLMHESPEAQQVPPHVCAAGQHDVPMQDSPELQQAPSQD